MSDFFIPNVYCQVNTIRGNRYLDDAGKIMNLYEEQFSSMNVGVDGLVMSSKGEKFRQAKVTTDSIWTSFRSPDTLQYVYDHGLRFIKAVADIIEVSHASRFGLRVESVMPAEKTADIMEPVLSNVFSEGLLKRHSGEPVAYEVFIERKMEGLTVALRIKPVERVGEPKPEDDAPERGLMFDADIHRDGGSLPIDDLRKFFRNADQWLKSTLPEIASTARRR